MATKTTRFRTDDLFKFNSINLDPLTETYQVSYYVKYICFWPEYCLTIRHPHTDRPMGYILGKVEGSKQRKLWHGHVTAVTVSPDSRKLGIGQLLMKHLEEITEKKHKGYFVDLFVRCSNLVAIKWYENLGYIKYRRIKDYYSNEEDGYDMRKATSHDPKKASMVPITRLVNPSEMLGEYTNDPGDVQPDLYD